MIRALFDQSIQFQHRNGTILSGGKIYVYHRGRTELAVVYSDDSGTVSSNPVILNDMGMANVFVHDGYTYTMVCTDQYGKELFSLDKELSEGGSSAGSDIIINGSGYVEVLKRVIAGDTVYTVKLKEEAEGIIEDAATETYVDNSIAAEANERARQDAETRRLLDDKKDKQLPVRYASNNTRTITELQQDENGKIVYVKFSDIDIPQEVPNIEIESSTLDVSSEIDPDTNTKTFTIELDGSELDYYNAGKNSGTTVVMDNVSNKWLPLANANNTYSSHNLTFNSDYTQLNLDPNKKYLCVAEINCEVINANVEDTIAIINMNYQIGEGTANPFMHINVDMSYGHTESTYISWLTEPGATWTGIYAGMNGANNAVLMKVDHFFAIEQNSISGGTGGGGTEYTAGDGIYIDSDNEINVLAGNGLEFDANNKLQVKLGKGLKFDTEAGIEGEISIDDIGQEVIEQVLELASELDKKITTTFNYAQITSMADFAPFGVQGTTRLIGQLFAVPIASEIRLNDTLISVRAQQGYAGNVSFGIFEFDFDGNDGTGSTTWLCDTGVVRVNAGENMLPVKHIVSTSVTRPVIKMEPGKLYYATILIAGNAPATGLYLASCDAYEANYNATPKYTMVASNMDNYVDWSNGSQEATWFQGYNEFHNIPRLFMMIRNGEATPVPTIDPFNNYSSFTLDSTYKYSDIFSLDFTGANYPVAYQKIIPQVDVTVTDIGFCDMKQSLYDYTSDIPLVLDNSYTSIVNVGDANCTIGNNDGYTIDGTHFYHQFTLNTPLNLTAGTIYWVPVSVNLSNGKDDTIVTYSVPSAATKDVIVFTSKWNINQWAIGGGYAEFKNAEPAPLVRIIDENNKEYTF